MSKRRVWHTIIAWDDVERHYIIVAKVRTLGLAHLTLEFYRTLYTDIRIE